MKLSRRCLREDSYLEPFFGHLDERRALANRRKAQLGTLAAASRAHDYFGLHRTTDGWVFREWAPHATAIFLVGDHSDWQCRSDFSLTRRDHGEWELHLPAQALRHGQHYRLEMFWPGGQGSRLPSHARRVVQDQQSLIFTAQVWEPAPYVWKHESPLPNNRPLLIYEAHAGMALERAGVGTWIEFREQILPRIAAAGYNTVQLMAVMEHPYYASFGYHVANFFAPSSRFGTPEELKELIDAAHGLGLAVIMDLVHSHSVKNELEGLSRFDGTAYQYFHDGDRGNHAAWDSRCFHYAKPEVLRFLLSNCRYWLEEFRFDGFRFDGVTSMLYTHHGLGKVFTSYQDYFDDAFDADAYAYLTLANELIHEICPHAITIAEDVSGMPGLGAAPSEGGAGFDFRLAMGVPDIWFKLAADARDEDWNVEHLFYELMNRRADERTISYVESHDQALVGGKSFFHQLADAAVYDGMAHHGESLAIDRALALHKLARLLTFATAGDGWLNFIGNEFGHPEWVDFPREGNGWSYHYARRQWHLRDDPNLKFHGLAEFDRKLLTTCGTTEFFAAPPELRYSHVEDHLLAIQRGSFLILLNFHPTRSFSDHAIPAPPGRHDWIFDTDQPEYSGPGRIVPRQQYFAQFTDGGRCLLAYLPSRCGIVLRQMA